MAEPKKSVVRPECFKGRTDLPYSFREDDLRMAMQDVCDFMNDVNSYLWDKGFARLDDMIRPAGLSGTLSDMLTDSLGKHSRALTPNTFHNGHPDLLVKGRYPNDGVDAGQEGVEVKTSRKSGGAVDTHGARNQWLVVFTYEVDNRHNIAAVDRLPLIWREVYINQVDKNDFRLNKRGELGTDTATLHADGLAKWRQNPVYLDLPFNTNSKGDWRARPGKG